MVQTEPTRVLTIRLPVSLHERLTRTARHEHRSMSAQAAFYIERGLDADGKGAHDDRETPPRAR